MSPLPEHDATSPDPRAPVTRTPAGKPPWSDDLVGLRLNLASLQAEAEAAGVASLAEAYQRLNLLTEVWDCLQAQAPREAEEVARFISDAMATLGSDRPEPLEPNSEAWVLRESIERWGDYLRLIDPEAIGERSREETPPAGDDAPSAIDADALFRMLTGDAGPSTPTEPDWPASPGWPPAPTADEPVSRPSERPATSRREQPATGGAAVDVSAVHALPAIDPELRDTFLAEGCDLFDRIEALVLSFGRGGRQAENLHELGRCFHTLKGAAGSVGLGPLAALIHGMETRLESAAGEVSEGLLDELHRLLHSIEGVFLALRRGDETTPEPAPPVDPRARAAKAAGPLAPPTGDKTPPRTEPAAAPLVSAAQQAPAGGEGTGTEGPVRVSSERVDELMDLVSELITRRGLWAAQSEGLKETTGLLRSSRLRLANTLDRVRDLAARPAELPVSRFADGPARSRWPGEVDRQVDLQEVIRRLAEQTEDVLVLTEAAQSLSKPLSDNGDALARLSLKLWESLQAIRIVPVRGLFQRLARVAHDASRVEGRQVEVVMTGEETGVDRAVQDKAFEPLLHVVRNAVGHGIEPPEERVKAGKPATGKVTLGASRTGNTLVLCVQDDGRGLDYRAIADKGRRLGLIGAEDSPSTERLNALIFQAGFSTRDEANTISGRGVGMDVVSQEVARLHGSISLDSKRGQGVRMFISLPARLALQQAMVARVGGQALALPVELVELAQAFEPENLCEVDGWPVVQVREKSVPLVDLHEALDVGVEEVSCPKLLLIRADGDPVAVKVDAIDGTCELVVKPLGPLLAGHPLVSGTSLSVTGEVIFTLNPSGLVRGRPVVKPAAGPSARAVQDGRSVRILVVDDSISVRKVVARLLRALGHEVEEVSDGLEALGRLRANAYALVISDLEMPRMDGFELLAELSRLAISQSTPVIIASTRSDPETRRKALGLGARAFLPKPIEPDALGDLVGQHLGGCGAAGAGRRTPGPAAQVEVEVGV
jgi:chemotaxis protein histidine kinase CheA/ActR/RegA family two-component response regulator